MLLNIATFVASLGSLRGSGSTAQAWDRHLEGSHLTCLGQREHKVSYNVTHAALKSGGPSIEDIDSMPDLKEVKCNVDESSLQIVFHDEIHSSTYYAKFKTFGAFLVGGDKHGCPLPLDQIQKGFLLRRVTGASLAGQFLTVNTVPAAYDEIYEDATIKYEPTNNDCSISEEHDADADADKRVCIGINQGPECGAAKGPITLYKNYFISLICKDCFVALRADVFFHLEIKGFKLEKLQAGFKQIDLQQNINLEMDAQKSWSTGVDKDIAVAPPTTLISFKIGSVPFVVWFEAPLHVTADASLQATATASAGIAANYSIGDYYVSWDSDNAWQHVKPSPQLAITPTVTGAAGFQGSATLSVVPSFTMHANKLFTYTLTLTPDVQMSVTGDAAKEQICEQGSYNAALSSQAELKLNIDWAKVHVDKQYGPTTIWSKQGTIAQHCASASNGTAIAAMLQ